MSSSYSSLDWLCLTGPILLCLDSFVFVFVFLNVYLVTLHMCCIIVTRWGGCSGMKPNPWTSSFSALTLVGWVIWPIETVPDMTCNVFGGTSNLTLSKSVEMSLVRFIRFMSSVVLSQLTWWWSCSWWLQTESWPFAYCTSEVILLLI